MRPVSAVIVSLAALAVSASAAFAQEGGNTDDMDLALAAGWKAAFTCSDLFTAGQSMAEIDQNDLSGIYPDYQRAFDTLPKAQVNTAMKTVSVTYWRRFQHDFLPAAFRQLADSTGAGPGQRHRRERQDPAAHRRGRAA